MHKDNKITERNKGRTIFRKNNSIESQQFKTLLKTGESKNES